MVCIYPPKIHMLKSQCLFDDIRRWGPWKVIHHESGALMSRIISFIKEA